MTCQICRSGMEISGWFERGTTALWQCEACGYVKDRPSTPVRFAAAILASRAAPGADRPAPGAPRVVCGRRSALPFRHGPAYVVGHDAPAPRQTQAPALVEANISAEAPTAYLQPARNARRAMPRFLATAS